MDPLNELEIVFTGNIPSKKNSKRICRRGRHVTVLPSKAYEAWHEKEKADMVTWDLYVPSPVSVDFKIQIGGVDCPSEFDLDNTVTSVMDLLVNAGILADDSWLHVPSHSVPQVSFVRGETVTVVTIRHIEQQWFDIVKTLQNKERIKALASEKQTTQVAIRKELWERLQQLTEVTA
jgi:Holliday junction resolvase RusA-like endonuclease